MSSADTYRRRDEERAFEKERCRRSKARLQARQNVSHAALKLASEVFSSTQWRNERVFILAGGPSLKRFPFEVLRHEKTIAVNSAWTAGVADVVLTGDLRWLKHGLHLNEFPERLPLVYARRKLEPVVKRPGRRLGRRLLMVPCAEDKAWGQSFEEGVALGCSALRAANFAALLGAKEIFLLGVDLREPGWWHEGYTWPVRETAFADYKEAWDRASRVATTPIINLNVNSGLDAFPKMHWEDVLL